MAALRLKVIYGTALAVELALRKQDAEQDVDIAECACRWRLQSN
jgi:hypothetical protein